MMLVAAQSFAGWSITNPDDDEKYADESNIVAEGTGGGPVQTYLVKLKRPDGTTAQEVWRSNIAQFALCLAEDVHATRRRLAPAGDGLARRPVGQSNAAKHGSH